MKSIWISSILILSPVAALSQTVADRDCTGSYGLVAKETPYEVSVKIRNGSAEVTLSVNNQLRQRSGPYSNLISSGDDVSSTDADTKFRMEGSKLIFDSMVVRGIECHDIKKAEPAVRTSAGFDRGQWCESNDGVHAQYFTSVYFQNGNAEVVSKIYVNNSPPSETVLHFKNLIFSGGSVTAPDGSFSLKGERFSYTDGLMTSHALHMKCNGGDPQLMGPPTPASAQLATLHE